MNLKLAGFAGDSIVDGPGIRFTTFCQGCPHHCPGCHNPETWPFEGGFEVTAEELLAHVKRNPLVRGVTFSGGEPFAQAAAHAETARLLKAAGYEVASYTGYTFEQLLAEGDPDRMALLESLDILVDGPFIQDQCSLTLRFRGSANQRILNVPKSLAAREAVWETRERWVGGEY
ncbi:MAG: anaerobic ribonucleoside-triphosphate reductase activating protein [Oscillospiraceae bacterium]|nr:anaerobic ribonucleoside-triphosphate reductase activating protein [Oscillospiraceae bacterium]